jgi:hypothetical protein
MGPARAVAVGTGAVAVGLLVWLTLAQWDLANRVAAIASAVGTVAAAGIAVWAVLRTPPTAPSPTPPVGGGIRVEKSGRADTGPGGTAITGVRVRGVVPPGGIEVTRSGPACATGTGDGTGPEGREAVTGVDVGDG